MTIQPVRTCPLCGRSAIRGLQSKSCQVRTGTLARCESCGLHFTDPTPCDSQIERFYSGDFHAQLRQEGVGEREFGARFQRYVDWIAAFVPSGRTLDVGCATGLLPRMLKDRGYASEGLEMHPETAEWGAAHYGIPIQIGGLDEVASQTGAYDLITLTEVVEHTPHPVKFLTAVNRLLKTGGYALVTFPDIRSLKSRYYRLLSTLTRRDWVWVTCRIPLHIWEFSYETASATFDRAGFSIAGFRRDEQDGELSGAQALLGWPVKPLKMWPLAGRFGSNMEFMIRKKD
jgi:SAM-dependent methyltransferase